MGQNDVNLHKYTTKSTSSHSAKVLQPIVLSQTSTTRRVLLAIINDTKTATRETVSGTIIHQRKKNNDEWEDVSSIDLSNLKGGEGVRLPLDSRQTRRLYDGLTELYKLSEQGVVFGKNDYLVAKLGELIKVPEERRKYIIKLLEGNYGEEIWKELIDSNPDLATRLSLARMQTERHRALDEFEQNLKVDNNESYWQDFFHRNQWIFGYGLKYCFLNFITDQPNYGGCNVYGQGSQRGDFLLNSEAEVKFTVLVEIKTPRTLLLARSTNGKEIRYRNGAWLLGYEVTGGVSQLQTNCKSWQRRSIEPENSDLISEHIHTVNPKGLLVLGHTSQFENNREKIETFENYRRNISNPEIITFDELFERAKFIVKNDSTNK